MNAIQDFQTKFPNGKLVNLGAGLSCYQYCTKSPLETMEIDSYELIESKKTILSSQLLNVQDNRTTYLSGDLCVDREELFDLVSAGLNGAPSFVLIEGLFCFLNSEQQESILNSIRRIQTQKSILGISYWDTRMQNHSGFINFMSYVKANVDADAQFSFQTSDYYEYLNDYRTISHYRQRDLALLWGLDSKIPDFRKIGDESLVLLEKE